MQGIWLQDQSLSYRTDLPDLSLDNGAVLVQAQQRHLQHRPRGAARLSAADGDGYEFVWGRFSAGDLQGLSRRRRDQHPAAGPRLPCAARRI